MSNPVTDWIDFLLLVTYIVLMIIAKKKNW